MVLDVDADGGDEGVCGGRVQQLLQNARLAHPRVAHHDQLVAGVAGAAAGAAAALGLARLTAAGARPLACPSHSAAKTHLVDTAGVRFWSAESFLLQCVAFSRILLAII